MFIFLQIKKTFIVSVYRPYSQILSTTMIYCLIANFLNISKYQHLNLGNDLLARCFYLCSEPSHCTMKMNHTICHQIHKTCKQNKTWSSVSNFIVLLDFGGGHSSSSCCSCDRGKTKSTPSLKTKTGG